MQKGTDLIQWGMTFSFSSALALNTKHILSKVIGGFLTKCSFWVIVYFSCCTWDNKKKQAFLSFVPMIHLLKFHGHRSFGKAPAAKDLTINVTLPLTLNNPTLQVRFHRTVHVVCIPLCIPPWRAPPADWFFWEGISFMQIQISSLCHSFIHRPWLCVL